MVIYVLSPDCLSGVNPRQWQRQLLMCKAAQFSYCIQYAGFQIYILSH